MIIKIFCGEKSSNPISFLSFRLLKKIKFLMSHRFFIGLFFLFFIFLNACKSRDNNTRNISLENYQIADSLEIQLAASEPLIEAPVAMDFDNKGRMWVAEMRGYMNNLSGTKEDIPNGRISILEDDDGDGVADHSKVFLDSLILPRGLAHVYGGLLYVAPPNLWFVEINNDKPGKKTLVDSMYAEGGNPEHQPNGLLMNIDNWIYNANSNNRYQMKDGKWIKEPTSFRGQYGISQDNYGRLYYNSNETQLIGDYVLPNSFINNPYLKPKEAINKVLTDNQKVYPLHPTTVNRGYAKGILTSDSLLARFTAACSPLVYRGGQFPQDYDQNVFVCEPQANLVKRNILTFDGIHTSARQAWDDKEFLASTDESFRPVSLSNSPDGAMYVVDMHRGVVEHLAYATPYYKDGITAKKLDTVLSKGRILRIKNKNKKLDKVPDFTNASATGLVALLLSDNGWVRDRAQQLLVFRQDKSVVPELKKLAQGDKHDVIAIHALHILDGLDALSFQFLQKIALSSSSSMLTAHTLLLLEKYNNTADNAEQMKTLTEKLLNKKDTVTDLYVALALGPWVETAHESFIPTLLKLSQTYTGKTIYQEAIVNSLNGFETDFKTIANKMDNETIDSSLQKILAQTISDKQDGKMNSIFLKESRRTDARTNGMVIFQTTCATCHGKNGEGMENLAPPLNGSEYVEGPPTRLAMIILHGLEGPVHIKGKLYTLNGTMPNFANNFSDKEIGDVISYLHNAFVLTPANRISTEKIKELRNKINRTLTEKDLLEMPDTINVTKRK
jgi:mono/diheme cytochrome c family protein/glucose/arabinose dehydrogenase